MTEKLNVDIRKMTMENTYFRNTVLTNKHSQLVLMSIEPGDEIGAETHEVDQVLIFVDGDGQAVLSGKTSKVGADSLVEVPAGTKHNFINTGKKPLKLYTIYTPPEEEPGTVHKTKEEADAAEEEKHGKK